MRSHKRLKYINELGEPDSYKIDADEYERLVTHVGCDLNCLPDSDFTNTFVKTIMQGLPFGWVNETDIYDRPIYFDQKTKETTLVHPLATQLRKDFQLFLDKRKELNEKTKEHQRDTLIPESSAKQLEFQRRVEEKRKIDK